MFIDTPPIDNHIIIPVIEVADIVVIPIKPSMNDLRGAATTLGLCTRANKPFVFVIAQAIPRTNIAEQARLVLGVHGTVLPTVMHNRLAYASAMGMGLVAQEIDPSGKAADEIAAIWKSINTRLGKALK